MYCDERHRGGLVLGTGGDHVVVATDRGTLLTIRTGRGGGDPRLSGLLLKALPVSTSATDHGPLMIIATLPSLNMAICWL